MTTLCYHAAYADDSKVLRICPHQHPTVASAVACRSSAEEYVVAYQDGVPRALTPYEEVEYEYALHGGKISRRTISLLFFLLVYRNAFEPQS